MKHIVTVKWEAILDDLLRQTGSIIKLAQYTKI